jgi:pilus assembly protein CpaD
MFSHRFIPAGRFGAARVVSLIGLALATSACASKAPTEVTANDYRTRHQLTLADGPVSIDVFPTGRTIDDATRAKVRQFAGDYLRNGRGPIAIQTPRGTINDAYVRMMTDAIRSEIAGSGVTGAVSVGPYDVADPKLASPIRLSYLGLTARPPQNCGQWPADLASGSSLKGWDNTPHWNHGCAFQNAFAQQIADPRDLAGPRAETPSDVMIRTRAIKQAREGQTPQVPTASSKQ